MQQSPKQFDPSKLKINVECPEPRDIASGMSFNIQNQQPVTPQPTNRIPQPAQTQGKFQILKCKLYSMIYVKIDITFARATVL